LKLRVVVLHHLIVEQAMHAVELKWALLLLPEVRLRKTFIFGDFKVLSFQVLLTKHLGVILLLHSFTHNLKGIVESRD
jgi:hypothetical protein